MALRRLLLVSGLYRELRRRSRSPKSKDSRRGKAKRGEDELKAGDGTDRHSVERVIADCGALGFPDRRYSWSQALRL